MSCEVNPALTSTQSADPTTLTSDPGVEERGAYGGATTLGALTINSAATSPLGDVEVEDGKVEEVRKLMLLYGDHGFAHRLQDGEYASKYEWNRQERRTARTDVPLAILTQTEEDRERELQELERLERQKKTIDEDERIARELSSQEGVRSNPGQGGVAQGSTEETDDAELARRIQTEDLLNIERERIRRELTDEDYARRLQLALEAEERDDAPDSRMMTRLGREVTYHSLDDSASPLGDSGDEALGAMGGGQGQGVSGGRRLGGTTFIVGRFRGFELPPEGTCNDMMSERERKELIHLQDEELAKALQEQENMRSLNLNSASDTASRDAQLAYVMQQLEQLRAEQNTAGTAVAAGGIRNHMMIQPPAYGNIYSPTPSHPPGLGSPPAYQRQAENHPPNPSQRPVTSSNPFTLGSTTSSMENQNISAGGRSTQGGVQNTGAVPNQSPSAGTVPTSSPFGTVPATAVHFPTNDNSYNLSSHHENENFVNEIDEHIRRQNSQPSTPQVQGGTNPFLSTGTSRPLPTPPPGGEPTASSQSQPNSPISGDVFMSPDGGRGQFEGQRTTSRSMSVGAAGTSDQAVAGDSRRHRMKLGGRRKSSCKTQ